MDTGEWSADCGNEVETQKHCRTVQHGNSVNVCLTSKTEPSSLFENALSNPMFFGCVESSQGYCTIPLIQTCKYNSCVTAVQKKNTKKTNGVFGIGETEKAEIKEKVHKTVFGPFCVKFSVQSVRRLRSFTCGRSTRPSPLHFAFLSKLEAVEANIYFKENFGTYF